jgi:hypothetical protein
MSGEGRMVRGGLLAGALALPIMAGLATALRGSHGGLAAITALALVLANFAVAGYTLVFAARRSKTMFPAVALPSYAFRMLGVLMAMKYLHDVPAIDRPTFAITFGVGVAALLAYECWLYAKTPWLALTFSPPADAKEST